MSEAKSVDAIMTEFTNIEDDNEYDPLPTQEEFETAKENYPAFLEKQRKKRTWILLVDQVNEALPYGRPAAMKSIPVDQIHLNYYTQHQQVMKDDVECDFNLTIEPFLSRPDIFVSGTGYSINIAIKTKSEKDTSTSMVPPDQDIYTVALPRLSQFQQKQREIVKAMRMEVWLDIKNAIERAKSGTDLSIGIYMKNLNPNFKPEGNLKSHCYEYHAARINNDPKFHFGLKTIKNDHSISFHLYSKST